MKRIALAFVGLFLIVAFAQARLEPVPTAGHHQSVAVLYPKLYAGDYVMIVDPASPLYGQFATVLETDLGGGPAAANEIIWVWLDGGGSAFMRRWQLSNAL